MSVVVGIAGGSGSGKSTLARLLRDALGPDEVTFLEQDQYYRDASHLPDEARALDPGQRNYDHPDAIDESLLLEHLHCLRAGRPVQAPAYDFVHHVRRPETSPVAARQCILLEGILVLALAGVREALDLRLFVDTDADLRFIRRLQRDVRERGRTQDQVIRQWEGTVRPMHLQFVEPSKRYADLIIPGGGLNSSAVAVLVGHLRLLTASRT
jgi:uridine kinase